MKGQAFSTFKILIGAVFAVTLLAIIYSVVSAYTSPISGIDTVKDLLVQAGNAPDMCFSRKMVEFTEGTVLTKQSFSPISIGCFKTAAAYTSLVQCSCDTCSFVQKAKIVVSAKCSSGSCDVVFGSETCG